MKRKILIAAGLLCLGTSPAFAFTIQEMKPDMAKAVKDVWADQMASGQPSALKTGEAWIGESKMPKVESSAVSAFDDGFADKAVGADTKMTALGDPDLDLSAKPDDVVTKSGPSEAVMATTSTPAAAAYPPCRPGAGDDHCIQLYEPGVRAQLANWERSAGGAESAMGGPYEPVDTTLAGELGGPSTTQLAMNDGGLADKSLGETKDSDELAAM